MTELYNGGYTQKLKKKRLYAGLGYLLMLCVFIAGYILSITRIGKEWLTMLIGILGVIIITSYYLALLAPIRVVFKMLKEARLGIRTKESLTFASRETEETFSDGIEYAKYNFYGRDEKGVLYKREILVDKTFDPIGFAKDKTYELETYQSILLGYSEKKR